MDMNVRKPVNPWERDLIKLGNLEHDIKGEDASSMLKRWEFGRLLAPKRVTRKGRLELPTALMKLTIEQCGISHAEICRRIKFAERYPTKKEAFDAVKSYPSWHQMFREGLVDKKRTPKARKQKEVHSAAWHLKRLKKEVEKAFVSHATLTREHVKDIEGVMELCRNLLAQIDRNDAGKAERKIS